MNRRPLDRRRFRGRIRRHGRALVAASLLLAGSARADDYGAVQTGNWEDPATWISTGGGVPGASDDVFIGGAYPAGAATTATVALNSDVAADAVYLGYDNGGSGTLVLNGNNLTANSIFIGYGAGTTGAIDESGGGSFTATNLTVDNGNSFTFGSADTVQNLTVGANATVTTTATGNLASSDWYYGTTATVNGGTLRLGADLTLQSGWWYGGGTLSVGGGGTLDMGGHAVSADAIELGSYGSPGGWTIANQGQINANVLDVYGGPALTLGAADTVGSLSVYAGASVTTSASTNFSQAYVSGAGSTLTLGADANGYGTISVGGGGTLDAQGHNIATYNLYLGTDGGSWTLANQGQINVFNLSVDNGSLTLGTADTTNSLYVGTGGTVTTTAAANITATDFYYGSSVDVVGGKLVLGADLNSVPGYYGGGLVSVSAGGTLDAQGHNITAGEVELGMTFDGPWSLLNRGTITTGTLAVANGSLALTTADSVAQNLTVGTNGIVTLAQDLNIAGTLSVYGGGSLQGAFNLTANDIELGTYGGSWSLDPSRGAITTQSLGVANGSLALTTADSVAQNLTVGTNGIVTLAQDLNIAGTLSVYGGGSLLGPYNITASDVELGMGGGSWSLDPNRGAITTQYLSVANGTLALTAADSVAQNLTVAANGTVVLGASQTNLAGTLYVAGDSSGVATLDMNGHAVQANDIELGSYWYGGNWAVANQGQITANSLSVYGGPSLTLGAIDAVGNLNVGLGASVATSATGNVANYVSVWGTDVTGTQGSTLTLGADLNVAGTVSVYGGGVIDAQGHGITANDVELGTYGGSWSLLNRGAITTQSLGVAYGSLTMTTSDSVSQNLTIGTGGTVTLAQDLNLTNALSINYGGALLGAYNINAGDIELGTSWGTWSLDPNRGTITTQSLAVGNGTLNLTAADSVSLDLNVSSGGKIVLGADMNLGGTLSVDGGYGSLATLDMAGHAVQANDIELGSYYTPGNWSLQNRGQFTAGNLSVFGGAPITLQAGDSLGQVQLFHSASMTTAATSNITGNVYNFGSNLTLGADMNLAGGIVLARSFTTWTDGVLDMQGHALSAFNIELGLNYDPNSWSILNQGQITATFLNVNGGSPFTFGSQDQIARLGVFQGADVTTAATSNVSSLAWVFGSTLRMGADLSLNSQLLVDSDGNTGAHGVLDMQGHKLFADSMTLGNPSSPGGWSLLNQGQINANSLSIFGGSPLALGANDSLGTLYAASGATLSTSAAGNVTWAVTLDGQGTSLSLGAGLSLTGNVNLTNGATLDAHGYDINAAQILVGYYGSSPAGLINPGAITADQLYLGNGSSLTLTSGRDTIGSLIYLQGSGTTLTVEQLAGQTTGLTLNGTSAGSLVFDPGPSLVLDLGHWSGVGDDWVFRWQDPSGGGNWIGQILADIADGEIIVNAADGGYQVFDEGGYTYIGYLGAAAVPEPSSVVLAALGVAGVLGWRLRRRGLPA